MYFDSELLASCDDPLLTATEEDVVEIPLLLPLWQMSALEKAAYLRGMTAAEMLRQAIGELIASPESER